jgi:OPA family glycerol-3-phosphate transporter-like MFS transporter
MELLVHHPPLVLYPYLFYIYRNLHIQLTPTQSTMQNPNSDRPVHSRAYRRRRIINWLPLGMTYAFLYMARYNLTVSKNALGDLMPKEAFGIIFAAGTITYAFSFLLNGPLTDKIGGKRAMLVGAGGAALMNIVLGVIVYGILALHWTLNLTLAFSVIYSLNMYFQSYGAVAIVKVNSAWFHVRERGTFGGIFGILISLGLYFAFDWSQAVVNFTEHANPTRPEYWLVFFIPAGILLFWLILDIFILRDSPGEAGFEDFNTGDASSGEAATAFRISDIMRRIFTNKVIITVGAIEFCTGVLRNGVMHWFPIYAKEQISADAALASAWNFWVNNWGLILMLAGASGGMLAGWMSDRVFGSRRAPVAGILYGALLIAIIGMMFVIDRQPMALGILLSVVSVAVIGTHGMLSGTATMDFGGTKAAATAVGLIDGLVYLGTGVQSLSLGYITTWNWHYWPVFLLPFGILGITLTSRIWNAIPKGKAATH